MNIFDIFKRKKTEPLDSFAVEEKQPVINEPKKNLFQCHYCYCEFEVTAKMQFPISVPSVGKEYNFPGIGVLCPECHKTCIYN